MRFKNKTVIVTGASSGIGAAIAKAMGSEGANVVINYFGSREGAEDTLRAVEEGGGRGHILHGDMSREEDVLQLFAETEQVFGALDLLVANAGRQIDAPFRELSLEQWNGVIGLNLTGYFLCAREAVKVFSRKGRTAAECTGNIILISSVHDIIPWAGHANYAASKGGVLMLAKTLAQEVAPQGIRVNAVSPGAIRTPINEDVWKDEEKMKELMKLIPYGRIGEGEDVARAVLFLAGPDSDYITGTTLYVDGGMTLYPAFADNG